MTDRDSRPEQAGDYGLFGPSSVTWRIMTEPVMWVAGLRALHLQAPGWARKLYGAPGGPLTEPAVTIALRATYLSTTRIPPRLLLVPDAVVTARRMVRAA